MSASIRPNVYIWKEPGPIIVPEKSTVLVFRYSVRTVFPKRRFEVPQRLLKRTATICQQLPQGHQTFTHHHPFYWATSVGETRSRHARFLFLFRNFYILFVRFNCAREDAVFGACCLAATTWPVRWSWQRRRWRFGSRTGESSGVNIIWRRSRRDSLNSTCC